MRSDEILFSLQAALEGRERAHQFRRRRVLEVVDATHVRVDGITYVNFASNNYLGLSHHPKLIDAANATTAKYGTGAGAAGLITGFTEEHAAAEEALAGWKGTERAVLMPSGYQANLAAVQAVAAVGEASGRGVRFLIDKLCHASLIDAVRGREMRVFPHNNLAKLERLLSEAEAGEIQVVVTESIFSMDGDAADLVALAELKKRHAFVLVLDEAHGSGVYGANGAGLAAELGVSGVADLTTVTLSKAMGSLGGAICGSAQWCDAVVNFGRASIYTTSVPAAVAAVARAAVGLLREEPGRRERVRELARQVRREVGGMGFEVGAGDSPIVPVVLGEESSALAAAEGLMGRRMLVVAVRPPTVAAGTSRLRVTLSSGHTDEEVGGLVEALRELQKD